VCEFGCTLEEVLGDFTTVLLGNDLGRKLNRRVQKLNDKKKTAWMPRKCGKGKRQKKLISCSCVDPLEA